MRRSAASESMPLAPAAASDWSIVDSPNSTATLGNVLTAITCVSASDCWAVGHYNTPSATQTLIEHWDGARWAIVASPNTSVTQDNILRSVTCVSASDCWAVGDYFNADGVAQTLIERWDGTSWTIVASPNVNPSASACILAGQVPGCTRNNSFHSVACESASTCWAVGAYYVEDVDQTLIARWNGTAWTVVTSPNTSPTQRNVLYSATCASPSDCWAVGVYAAGFYWQTLIEHWDGTSWTIVTSPNTGATQGNLLFGVTCLSASDCWAVGFYKVSGAGADQTPLIQQWDGISWTIVASPNTSSAQSPLLTVTCASASECWAVGYYRIANIVDDGAEYFGDQTLIARWDGTSWTIVTSPNTSANMDNHLYGVTCASASECWAVGYYGNPGDPAYQTLVLKYRAPAPPTPTNVVSRKTHGTAGDLDIDLPLAGDPGIECRQGQGINSDEHQVVFTFDAPATVVSASCDGKPATTSTAGNDIAVNCPNVANAKVITVALSGVTVGNSSGNVSIPMAVLVGDTTASGSVNSSDISQTKSQSGQAVTSSNFRQDVTVNGSINSSDISLVKSKSGTALP